MADPGQIVIKLLSASTDGKPIIIVGTTPATATLVHTHDGTANTIDLPGLMICNVDSSADIEGGVVIYSGATPTDPDSIAWRGTIPAKSGAYVAIAENLGIQNSLKIGVWGGTTLKLQVTGRVGKAYVAA